MYTPRQFLQLARGLIKAQDHPDEMRRYLELRRRLREAGAALRAARRAAREANPLHGIGFAAPLSVAGEGSSVVVRAEHLARHRDVPVAFALDERGAHRGTAMDAVRAGLAASGQPRNDVDILALYERYVRAEPLSPEDRALPGTIRELAAERKRLEGLIVGLLDHPKYNTRRFMVVVERDLLAEAVGRIEPRADKVVIVSYGGEGKDFVVDGHRVPVMVGEKAGAQTLWYADLCGMTRMGGAAICVDCHALHWVGWVSDKDDGGGTRRVGPLRYGYPGLKREANDESEVE